MRSIKVGEKPTTYICAHWRTFPPPGAGDIEKLRASMAITTEQYQRLQIWKRECGLLKMEGDKCSQCKHVRWVKMKLPVPVLVDPQGMETPIVDSATYEASPRNRHLAGVLRRPGTKGSHEHAAWVKQVNQKDDDG